MLKKRIAFAFASFFLAVAVFFAVPYTRGLAQSFLNGLHYDALGNLYVNCNAGCGGGAGSPLTGGATSIPTNNNQAVAIDAFNGTTLDALKESSGNLFVNCQVGCSAAPLSGGASGITTGADQAIALAGFNGTTLDAIKDTGNALWVNCQSGCASSAPLTGGASGVTTAANQGVAISGFNGTTLDAIKDTSNALWVNCQAGCSGAAPLSGGTNGIATGANQAIALAGFNGTTLDAIKESSGNLFTALQTAIPAGSNAIGQVGQNGTWTVQPGNTANTTPWLMTINQGGNSASVTAANALKVDGSAVTQPVSGTVTANEGAAPWSVTNRTNSAGAASAPLCDSSAVINTATSGETQLVALSSGKKIYICSFSFQAGGTVNVTLQYGTASCASVTAMTGPYPEVANTGVAHSGGNSPVFTVPAGNALCIALSAAVQVSGVVSYTQY